MRIPNRVKWIATVIPDFWVEVMRVWAQFVDQLTPPQPTAVGILTGVYFYEGIQWAIGVYDAAGDAVQAMTRIPIVIFIRAVAANNWKSVAKSRVMTVGAAMGMLMEAFAEAAERQSRWNVGTLLNSSVLIKSVADYSKIRTWLDGFKKIFLGISTRVFRLVIIFVNAFVALGGALGILWMLGFTCGAYLGGELDEDRARAQWNARLDRWCLPQKSQRKWQKGAYRTRRWE